MMIKGLDALETIKNCPTIYVGCVSDVYTRCSFECKTIEKELKALEIIKKYINADEDENGLYWLNLIGCASIGITQEEYDLLKEIKND